MGWPGRVVTWFRGNCGGTITSAAGTLGTAVKSLGEAATACEVFGAELVDGGSIVAAIGDSRGVQDGDL